MHDPHANHNEHASHEHASHEHTSQDHAGHNHADHQHGEDQHPCGGCGDLMESPLFCFSCERIQPVKGRPDPFKIMGLPAGFELDQASLDRRYQKLAAELHPDFFAASSDKERAQSQSSSILLNQAYYDLKDPFRRANSLLSLLSKGAKLNERALPDGFLQEMFMLQEELGDFLAEDDQDKLLELKSDIKARRDVLVSELTGIFGEALKANAITQNDLEAVQMRINAEKYLDRLLERLH